MERASAAVLLHPGMDGTATPGWLRGGGGSRELVLEEARLKLRLMDKFLYGELAATRLAGGALG